MSDEYYPEFSILIIGDNENSDHIENGLNYLLDEYGVFRYIKYSLSKESPIYFNDIVKNILDNLCLLYDYIDGLDISDKIYIRNKNIEIDEYFTTVVYFSELKNTKLISLINDHYKKKSKRFDLYIC